MVLLIRVDGHHAFISSRARREAPREFLVSDALPAEPSSPCDDVAPNSSVLSKVSASGAKVNVKLRHVSHDGAT